MLNLRLVTRRVHSNVKELADGIVKGDRSSLARAITLVESKLPEDSKTAQDLFKQLGGAGSRKETMRIGISGSPGVGKSSLIEKLGMFCIEREGWRVATLAIDPSSPKSGGSILGDKTRMSKLSNDGRAFVRPSPSGGQLGGVARGTFSSIKLCELAGYDVVFVESVGVGQSETQLSDLTDIFILCSAPMSGDDLQALKRGISERADLILLNKAEEPLNEAARKSLMELKMSQSLRNRPAQVLPVSAWNGTGIHEAWTAIKQLHRVNLDSGEFYTRRRDQQLKWLKSFIQDQLTDRFDAHLNSVQLTKHVDRDPVEVAHEIIKDFCREYSK